MHGSDFMIAGIRLRVETDRRDAPPFAMLREDLRLMEVPLQGDFDIKLRLYPRSWEEPSPLKLPPEARMILAGGRKIFKDDEKWYIDFHENAFFIIDGFECSGVCYGDERLDPFFWTEICLNYVMTLMMRRKGRFLLHAGGASHAGRGCFFIGPSHSGKSTAAFRLAQAGWNYFGDDIVYVDPSCRIYPYPKRAAATDWTVAALGIEDRVVMTRPTGKKVILPWSAGSEGLRDYVIFHPLPATGGQNTISEIEDPSEILESQMMFCHTDQIVGGPLPDLRSMAERMMEIRIGNLETLPEFLAEFWRDREKTRTMVVSEAP